MPKSSVRKKKVYTPPADMRTASTAASRQPSPSWVGVTAVVLILFGLVWLVTFYLSDQNYPVASWGYWNLAVGFASLVGSVIQRRIRVGRRGSVIGCPDSNRRGSAMAIRGVGQRAYVDAAVHVSIRSR